MAQLSPRPGERLAKLIGDNLRLLRQRKALSEDEPTVTLQVGMFSKCFSSALLAPAPATPFLLLSCMHALRSGMSG